MNKPIHKHAFDYVLIREFVGFFFRLFFRKVTAIGKENIPKGEPVLFAVNHQCALMDAFAVIYTLYNYQVFMARADIFKNKSAAKFLRFIKILPIFRMRDGIKNLSNNDSSFDEAVGTLMANERLVILPEGSHFGQKRLRSLKKGLARIAFQAEEQSEFKLGIKIIPVGVDYKDYTKFGSELLVQYGEPFTMEAYFDEYKENPQRAMSRLMGDLREKMIPMMLHVNDADNYEGIKAVCDLHTNYEYGEGIIQSQYEGRLSSQKVSDALIALKDTDESRFNSIQEKAIKINDNLTSINLRAWVLNKTKYSSVSILLNRVLQLIGLPIFLIGYLGNAIPFHIPVKLTKKVKDQMFLSSMRVSIASMVFTLYYLIILIILLLSLSPSWIALVVVTILGLSGIWSFNYYRWFVKTSARARNNRLKRRGDKTWKETHEDYQSLVKEVSDLLKV